MPPPTPLPGLVASYADPWRDRQKQGGDEGLKDRPCVVVLAVRREDGECIVTRRVLPFDGPTAQAPVFDRRHAGKLIPQADAQLAVVAWCRGASSATRDGSGADR